MAHSVGVITVWYGGEDQIQRFVANRRAITKPEFLHVCVLNRLNTRGRSEIEENFPDSVFLHPDGNIGPSAAWNMAIDHLLNVGVEYCAIWNPDVRLAEDCIARLIDVLKSDATIGAVSPLLFYADEPGTVQMFGGSVNPEKGSASHNFCGQTDVSALPELHDAEYLDGGTLVLPVSTIERVGKFDQQLFMYAEDSDMSIRIRKAGLRTVAVRDAHAWHYIRESRGSFPAPYQLYYETRNAFHLVRKHGDMGSLVIFGLKNLAGIPRRVLYYGRRGKWDLLRALMCGLWDGIVGRTGKAGWVD